jgi:apolipoprotein D and lipocalin family protein
MNTTTAGSKAIKTAITALGFALGVWISPTLAQPQLTEPAPAPLEAIATLDVPRYMGTWYEIAKYPNWFQKKCVSNTSAQYTAEASGSLTVLNRCQKADGSMSEALGAAKQVGSATSAKLEVRFAPAWLSFLPFVWGNYWVIDLDEQYQLAAVSEPTRKYLWILSRTKTVDPKVYDALLQRLQQKGFNLNEIERSLQTDAPSTTK